MNTISALVFDLEGCRCEFENKQNVLAATKGTKMRRGMKYEEERRLPCLFSVYFVTVSVERLGRLKITFLFCYNFNLQHSFFKNSYSTNYLISLNIYALE